MSYAFPHFSPPFNGTPITDHYCGKQDKGWPRLRGTWWWFRWRDSCFRGWQDTPHCDFHRHHHHLRVCVCSSITPTNAFIIKPWCRTVGARLWLDVESHKQNYMIRCTNIRVVFKWNPSVFSSSLWFFSQGQELLSNVVSCKVLNWSKWPSCSNAMCSVCSFSSSMLLSKHLEQKILLFVPNSSSIQINCSTSVLLKFSWKFWEPGRSEKKLSIFSPWILFFYCTEVEGSSSCFCDLSDRTHTGVHYKRSEFLLSPASFCALSAEVVPHVLFSPFSWEERSMKCLSLTLENTEISPIAVGALILKLHSSVAFTHNIYNVHL